MNKAVFGKAIENVRKPRDIKLVKTEARRNCLVSEPNCHTTIFFSEITLSMEMRKSQILMNKPAYLGLSILELSKIVTHNLWYDYVKRQFCEKVKLCCMDTDSFIVHDVDQTRFDTSSDEFNRSLSQEKNKKKLLFQ